MYYKPLTYTVGRRTVEIVSGGERMNPLRMPERLQEERDEARDRWRVTEGGRKSYVRVLDLIRRGAGEDFLQSDVENGRLKGFLTNMWDLRGFDLRNESIDFPQGDSFESIDFSYSYFENSTFNGAMFGARFRYAEMRRCVFKRCVFSFNDFADCRLVGVEFEDCEFIQGDTFEQCELEGCVFRNCFIPDNLFSGCRFSESTIFDGLPDQPQGENSFKLTRPEALLPDIYHGLRESYVNGRAGRQARRYYFKEMQALTRHSSQSKGSALQGWLLELLVGYGVRPLRVLIVMIVTYGIATTVMATRLGWRMAVVVTAGAMLTFGAHTETLDSLPAWYELLYVFLAFLGIALLALFVTVSANVFLRER
jgi:type IV secretory pathway VirB2 component (pilin)